MQNTKSNTLEVLLQKSLDQYCEMVNLLQLLQQKLENNSVDCVNSSNTTYKALINKIKETDQEVTQQLDLLGVSGTIKLFLEQRQLLQNNILNLIKKIASTAGSIKSFLANEMQSVRQGKKALSGYRSQPAKYGKIINKTL